MKWETIKTAPKDGTRILALSNGWVEVVAWRKMHDGFQNWGTDDESVYCQGQYNPTHWMPLPEPPK